MSRGGQVNCSKINLNFKSALMVLEVPVGPQGGLVPGTDVDFFKDVVKMGFYGVRADAQRCGNGPVGGAFHDLGQDVGLAG